ncbi:hypothetical protein L3X38_012348 [Prunus dulcis]|uniref:Uncharacterized protein n=1 Tax=Prunus dulcis TaxID=3755 RepID=A0AAD4WJV4_PRUDU|nr:hypothetical protein L3X38_012348 [Prunus dulcis]
MDIEFEARVKPLEYKVKAMSRESPSQKAGHVLDADLRSHRSEALAVTKAPAPPQAGTERPEDPREESITQQAEPMEDLELVTLHDDIPDRQVCIGTSI